MGRRVWVGILIGTVVGNAVGLGVYRWLDSLPARASKAADDPVDPASDSHRLAGLDAVEQGDYDRAIREFSAGMRGDHPAPDLPQLLTIAQKMRARAQAPPEPPAPAKTPSRADATAPEPAADAAPGLLLITSRPARLTIEIDGDVRDHSPARLAVPPGPHTVILRRGGDVVAERHVEVAAGQVVLIDEDVSARLEPSPPRGRRPDRATARAPSPARGAEPEWAPAASAGDRQRPAGLRNPDPAPSFPRPAPGSGREFGATTEASAPATLGLSGARAAAAATPAVAPRPDQRPPRREAQTRRRPPAIRATMIKQVAAAAQPKFEACYDRYRRFRRNLAGRAVLRLEVGADGRTTEASVIESTLQSSGMQRCLKREAREVRFPRPVGGPTEVSFVLRFEPPR